MFSERESKHFYCGEHTTRERLRLISDTSHNKVNICAIVEGDNRTHCVSFQSGNNKSTAFTDEYA